MSEETEARRAKLHELFGGKWEYEFLNAPPKDTKEAGTIVGKKIVELGEAGWECVGVVSLPGISPTILFKRRKVE